MTNMTEVVNTDLMKLNSHFLMVVQKQLLSNPITAKHSFGLDDESADFIAKLTPLEIQKLATSSISAVRFRFEEPSLSYLCNYVQGDDLAITQAILSERGIK